MYYAYSRHVSVEIDHNLRVAIATNLRTHEEAYSYYSTRAAPSLNNHFSFPLNRETESDVK